MYAEGKNVHFLPWKPMIICNDAYTVLIYKHYAAN